MSKPLRVIRNENGEVIQLKDLRAGDRFHATEPDGEDLGWWTAGSSPHVDENDVVGIAATPDTIIMRD